MLRHSATALTVFYSHKFDTLRAMTRLNTVSSFVIPRGPLGRRLMWSTFVLSLAHSVTALGEATADPRAPIQAHADPWHSAIGQLAVPVTRVEHGYTRHYTEHCTAVAVTAGPNPLILSAWHCVEGYRSLIEPIQLRMSGQRSPISVQLVASGGSMEQDWAAFRPTAPLSGASWIPVSAQALSHDMAVMAAGFTEYAAPPGAGPRPRSLVTHRTCRITDSDQMPVASDCVAKQGASGGAILKRTQSGSLRVIGIISAGDGESVSLFYPAGSLLPRFASLR